MEHPPLHKLCLRTASTDVNRPLHFNVVNVDLLRLLLESTPGRSYPALMQVLNSKLQFSQENMWRGAVLFMKWQLNGSFTVVQRDIVMHAFFRRGLKMGPRTVFGNAEAEVVDPYRPAYDAIERLRREWRTKYLTDKLKLRFWIVWDWADKLAAWMLRARERCWVPPGSWVLLRKKWIYYEKGGACYNKPFPTPEPFLGPLLRHAYHYRRRRRTIR